MEADRLSPELIAEGLGTCWLARNIAYYESVGSTNDEARRLALAGAPEGTLVLAEEQTAGRGRLQRRWLAPRGQALLFSLVFYPTFEARDAFRLTMLASLACVQAVQEQTGLRPEIKWPNDLLLQGKKLAGILSELGQAGDRLYAVVGIGLNVNVDFSPWPELREQATSLREALGRPVPRLPILQATLRRMEAGYDRLRTGASPFDEWMANLATLGQSVQVTTPEGTFEGKASGVDPDGALQVTLPDGSTRRVLAGDVESLRLESTP
ncbi:MAG: biotin--[acetyl-CoA-carboxylase] ligase [Anaerolineae bacterium]|nr:biotin--[acetyl-CoA-carboxylase] ligase [Anaerolineae bacterium]